jgi:hypothetical protein
MGRAARERVAEFLSIEMFVERVLAGYGKGSRGGSASGLVQDELSGTTGGVRPNAVSSPLLRDEHVVVVIWPFAPPST